jgi:septin family protein
MLLLLIIISSKMPFDIRIKTSFNLMLVGPTRSGKTSWVKNLLTMGDQIFTEKPMKVFLFYKMMQDMYVEMKETGYYKI